MFAINNHLIHLMSDPLPRDTSTADVNRLLSSNSAFRNPISGTVYGTLLNDRSALDALGETLKVAPYKAPPSAPILYVKSRNTLAGYGSEVSIPDHHGVQVGGSLGIVIGRVASRISVVQARSFIAGYTVVADLSIPHESVYRPSVRFRARDGFCVAGPAIVGREHVLDADDLAISVKVEGLPDFRASTATAVRNVAQLLADVTEFMTLYPGDVLTMGVPHGSPVSLNGGCVSVTISDLPPLKFSLKTSAQKEGVQ